MLFPRAFLAAWTAIEAAPTPLACDVAVAGAGGGGGVDRTGGGGGRGADDGGGGGGAAGLVEGGGGGGVAGLAEGGGGGGAAGLVEGGGGAGVEGFLDVAGGGGGLPDPGTGGCGRDDCESWNVLVEVVDPGLETGLKGVFRRFATTGLTGGGDSVDGGCGGGRVTGGFGAAGGFGADTAGGPGLVLSESER